MLELKKTYAESELFLGHIDRNHTCMCHAVWTKTNPVIMFSEKLHLNLIKCNKS